MLLLGKSRPAGPPLENVEVHNLFSPNILLFFLGRARIGGSLGRLKLCTETVRTLVHLRRPGAVPPFGLDG